MLVSGFKGWAPWKRKGGGRERKEDGNPSFRNGGTESGLTIHWYRACLHELDHSAVHKTQLNGDGLTRRRSTKRTVYDSDDTRAGSRRRLSDDAFK